MMISDTVQQLSHWQNKQTDRHTLTNRHYWKQYHLRYAIAAGAEIQGTGSRSEV